MPITENRRLPRPAADRGAAVSNALPSASYEPALDNLGNLAIIGGGWLGRPLAHALVAAGYTVTVTARSTSSVAALSQDGLCAQALTLAPTPILTTPWPLRAKQLIFCLPPSQSEDYAASIARACQQALAAGTQTALLISATSVWQPGQREWESPQGQGPRAARLLAAERALLNAGFARAMVLRPAGLYGPARHPVYYLAGRQLSGGDEAVNLVEQSDVIAAIVRLLQVGRDQAAFNLSAPVHPTRRDFYSAACQHLQLPAPQFMAGAYAPIGGQRIVTELGFTYRWPDPLAWLLQTKANSPAVFS
ncbi:MAG: 2-dehydropantoate 2-reductase N-terminal domain-containing protein [Aeromonas sp.]